MRLSEIYVNADANFSLSKVIFRGGRGDMKHVVPLSEYWGKEMSPSASSHRNHRPCIRLLIGILRLRHLAYELNILYR